LISDWNIIETQDVRYDIEISLIVEAASASGGHRIANYLKPVRDRLSLPSELEGALGKVGRLRFGAMQVSPVAAGKPPPPFLPAPP
jgi:hypothetical protein